MFFPSFVDALLLGIVEGLTEFLPVSSTGHLILVGDFLGFEGPPGKVFEIAIQLGGVMAIFFSYWRKLTEVMCGLLGKNNLSQGGGKGDAWRFVLNLLIAFLPAAVVGLAFHHFIKEELFNPTVVSWALIVGGVAILLIERMKPLSRTDSIDRLDFRMALKIGLFQMLALIPGVSRSGATIMGGLLVGLDRKTATEFSFFLAIPVIAAATFYDLISNWSQLDGAALELIAVGFVSAFLSALLVVNAMIGFVSRYGFGVFAWYRIALGTLMLFLLA